MKKVWAWVTGSLWLLGVILGVVLKHFVFDRIRERPMEPLPPERDFEEEAMSAPVEDTSGLSAPEKVDRYTELKRRIGEMR